MATAVLVIAVAVVVKIISYPCIQFQMLAWNMLSWSWIVGACIQLAVPMSKFRCWHLALLSWSGSGDASHCGCLHAVCSLIILQVLAYSGLKKPIFSAGNDLGELFAPGTSRERYKRFWATSQEFLCQLYVTPLVTVSAIRGAYVSSFNYISHARACLLCLSFGDMRLTMPILN
jgi:hypothetical protein